MRRMFAVLPVVVLLLGGCGGPGVRIVRTQGLRVTVPKGWDTVQPANAGPVIDPRTLLVVGTAGVHEKPSHCQVAAYRIPADAAVVLVLGWRSLADADGEATAPGRGSLAELVAVRRPSFECFTGRGGAAQALLAGKLYQVNVLVGDRASSWVVNQALAVARSFDLTSDRGRPAVPRSASARRPPPRPSS